MKDWMAGLMGAAMLSAHVAMAQQPPVPVPAPMPAPAVSPTPSVAPTRPERPARPASAAMPTPSARSLDGLSYGPPGGYASSPEAWSLTTARQEVELAQYRFNEARATSPWSGCCDDRGRASDPADSLYRQARELLNRGDYRKAVALFKDLDKQYPTSQYAAESAYWQAFALYRIGGTGDLQEALQLLDAQRSRYPAARTQADAAALATRIAGVLATRGQGDKELVKRALSSGAPACDREDLSVRAEALNALMQSEPETAMTMAKKILAGRDECASDLRRSVLFMVGNRKEPAAAAIMMQVARTETNSDLRAEAVSWLGRLPGDEALGLLEEIAGKNDDERVQRAAVRALVTHPNARARQSTRALLERNDVNERIRLAVVEGFSSDRMTTDDVAWLRGAYSKVESARVRSRIVQVLGNIKSEENQAWLLTVARNQAESSEVRATALRNAGRTLDVAALGKFYDSVGDRPLREQIIDLLGERKENEATDKLIEIARAGTDPNLRRSSINALTRKKDPRTTKLLLEIIDR